MSDVDDEDETYEAKSKCPICGTEFCDQHLVIGFADGHPHGGVLAYEWEWVAHSLKMRLVEGWLERQKKVDGPRDLTNLLGFFSSFSSHDRKDVLKKVAGCSNPENPANWSEEVYQALELDAYADLDCEIEQIMLKALHDVDSTAEVSHYYAKGPCVFSGNEIYASNPQAVERRFRMVLGLT